MERKEIDKEITRKLEEKYNQWGEAYEADVENITITGSVNLYSLTRAKQASRICEVGVGCGQASRMFISHIMKEGGSYFASDISEKMIKIFKTRFEESNFGTKIKLHEFQDFQEVDFEREANECEMDTKKVFILKANNELLPYPDSFFDRYLSSLSLMMVSNYQNQLSEAYRVLVEGGIAGFTVWGRPENTSFYTFIPSIFEEAGVKMAKSKRSSFHLSDKEFLVSEAKKAGFSEVKGFYTMTCANIGSGEEVYDFYLNAPHYKPHFDSLTSEQLTKIKDIFDLRWEEKYGKSSLNFLEWELLVIICTK